MINVDDPYGARLAAEIPGAVTFAIQSEADYRASDVQTGLNGSRFTVRGPDGVDRPPVAAAGAVQRLQRARRVRGRPRARRFRGNVAAAIETAGQRPGAL